MPPRLPELLKQRALLQEHLAWLDREIANEQSAAPMPPPLPHPALPTPNPTNSAPSAFSKHESQFQTSSFTPSSAISTPAPADEILNRYKQDAGSLQQDTRKGCLVAAAIAGAIALVLGFIVYALYARHLGRWW